LEGLALQAEALAKAWGGLKWKKDKRNYEVQEGNNFSGNNHDDPVG
jgi:hypothetical protein